MKKKITRIMTAMVLAVMMVFTAIPFASAATNANALDETKKVSFTSIARIHIYGVQGCGTQNNRKSIQDRL